MNSTLQSRMEELIAARWGPVPPRGAMAKIARAADVKSSSVRGWMTGKTKVLSGPVLLRVADFFGVSEDWLATGKGQREPLTNGRLGKSMTSGQERLPSHSMTPDPQILAEAMKWVAFEEGPLVKKPSGSLEPQYPYGTLLERMQRLSEIYALYAADGGTLSPVTANSLIDAARKRHNLGDVDSERREIASSSGGGRAAKR
jgi:transcriptional regulator with XRE-family HTH domain